MARDALGLLTRLGCADPVPGEPQTFVSARMEWAMEGLASSSLLSEAEQLAALDAAAAAVGHGAGDPGQCPGVDRRR
jgi:hypothetical protein